MVDTIGILKLEVVRGPEARELSKIHLYKPADFSYELFLQYRKLDPIKCSQKTAARFGKPSFSLQGPSGSKIDGWLLKLAGAEQVVYLESWPWEFFVYTSGCKNLMSKVLAWLSGETPDLRLVKGGRE